MKAGPGRGTSHAVRRLLPALLALLLAPACAERKPNLLRLYRNAPPPGRAVILIPGAFGSRLRDPATETLVWGDTSSLFKKLYRPRDGSADLLDLPIDEADPRRNRDTLEPAGIFERVVGLSLYGTIFSTLDEAGRYTPGDIRDPKPGQNLFTFDYDWRRDVAESAKLLGEAIERILEARGEREGRVDIVAHSLGGLIARYYVRYGSEDVLDREAFAPSYEGARHIKNLVLVGTPIAGTMDALESLLEGARILRRLPARAILTMPSAYQLLPHPDEPAVLDERGEPLDADIFDPATWERFGWSVFGAEPDKEECGRLREEMGAEAGSASCLEERERKRRFVAWALARARRLIEALEVAGGPPDTVRYAAFGGDCTPTPARVVVARDDEAGYATYFDPEKLPRRLRSEALADRMMAPGDGSVTRESLLGGREGPGGKGIGLTLTYTGFFCESHRLLTEETTFQDNLLHLLLERP